MKLHSRKFYKKELLENNAIFVDPLFVSQVGAHLRAMVMYGIVDLPYQGVQTLITLRIKV